MRRILRWDDVVWRSGLSKSTLYRMEKEGSFPRRVRLSQRTSGIFEDEFEAWQEALERVELAD